MKKITSKYWKQRQEQYFKNIEKDEKRLFKKLSKQYDKEINNLQDKIGAYYSKYGEDNIIEYKDLLIKLPEKERQLLFRDIDLFFERHPEQEHLRKISKSSYKISRLEALEYEMTKQQIELGVKEEELGIDLLGKGFDKTYKQVNKDMGFAKVMTGEVLAKDIVNAKWLNDMDFSSRLWSNKEKLIDFMINDFKNGIIRGDNYQKMGRILKNRFKKRSNNDIQRLIYTEGTFVQNQAMSSPFQDMGYTHYYYDAIMDDRTSDICQGLNGERFAFADKESGVNFPPMHSRCRSSFTVDLNSKQ